jgi:Transposase
MDTVHSAITEPVRRLEVFIRAGRRRKWSDEDKARIVAEIVASGDSVCSVARRHGLFAFSCVKIVWYGYDLSTWGWDGASQGWDGASQSKNNVLLFLRLIFSIVSVGCQQSTRLFDTDGK